MSGSARAITSASDIDAVGHRVVHGGPNFEDPVVVTPQVYSAIADVSEFAPLHIRAELEGMKIVENLRGDVPQIAVFDTGFHRQMPLRRQSTLAPMSGSRRAFAATDSTGSIISTVPSGRRRCSERM